MKERPVSIIGVGTALVDLKVIDPTMPLPRSQNEISEFLSRQNEVKISAGGSMATVMATLTKLRSSYSVNFLQRIGRDTNGDYYKQHTPAELQNDIQVDDSNPTGVCIFAISEGIQKIDQWPEVTFYGASDKLEIPEGTGAKGDIFITNINAFRRLSPKGQIVEALQEATENGNAFVFRLSGIQHGTGEKIDKKELDLLLASLPKKPDIIFANAAELQYASGIESVNQATQDAFPETDLIVVTNGASGSLVRFKDNVFEMPPEQVSQNDVVDTTGAGDTYMGVMLAALYTKPHSQWTQKFIASCVRIGTYASALVIQSFESRLTEPELTYIRGKIASMVPKNKLAEELPDTEAVWENPNSYSLNL